MKTIVKAIILSTLLYSCHKGETTTEPTKNISAVIDITDNDAIFPESKSVIKLFGFDTVRGGEAWFRISTVTDRLLNPAIEHHLPDSKETEKNNIQDDPNYRDKLIISFQAAIRKTIASFNSTNKKDTTLSNSECFATICNELQLMKKRGAKDNILLVYSNLYENSDFFNSYTKENIKIIMDSTEKVVNIFNETGLLPNSLNGYTIYFIYQPGSREGDKKYMAMVEVYKLLLEPRGAKIVVQATNDLYYE